VNIPPPSYPSTGYALPFVRQRPPPSFSQASSPVLTNRAQGLTPTPHPRRQAQNVRRHRHGLQTPHHPQRHPARPTAIAPRNHLTNNTAAETSSASHIGSSGIAALRNNRSGVSIEDRLGRGRFGLEHGTLRHIAVPFGPKPDPLPCCVPAGFPKAGARWPGQGRARPRRRGSGLGRGWGGRPARSRHSDKGSPRARASDP
jgi:hypothetical protein